jgi:hypothetical protein
LGIVPAARTISDRLEMMGEPTNGQQHRADGERRNEEISDKLHDKFGKKGKPFSSKRNTNRKARDQDYTSVGA